ncbi:MAG TPA: CocE/NonD family hydrolase [Methanobacteriaceae archaeon]|nr:CocE/NonD family hydrolase [Methanobacteriaceae archaeon]
MEKVPVISILFVIFLVAGVLYGAFVAENQTIINQSPLNFSSDSLNQTENQTQKPFNQSLNNSNNSTNLNLTNTNHTTINLTNTNRTTSTLNISNQTNYTFKTMVGLETQMRDGVKLISDVWMPQPDGKYPVILIRTPYGRSAPYMNYTAMGEYFASHGYVFMVQDVRGKGDSQGDFNFLFQEGQDGYDTIEWAANQPWANGKVGMMGSSYMGADQWLAAREKPPHLTCIAPTSATGRYMEEIPSIGGVFYMGWVLPWTLQNNGRTQDLNTQNINLTAAFNHRPLINADEVIGTSVPLYRQFLEHSTMDDYWKRIQFTEQDFTQFSLPTMTTCGWFDTDQPGALFYWRGVKKNFPNQNDQYIIIGPWIHSATFEPGAQLSKIGDLPVSGARIDVYGNHLSFFDHYLKNQTNTTNNSDNTTDNSNLPQATVYLTGINKWINLTTYPPEDINITPLYLQSEGQANTYNGNGFLVWSLNNSANTSSANTSLNNTNASSDSYTYDPANPRPVAMGSFAVDCLTTENRSDVLVYTTSSLEEPVMILGPVAVELYAASDTKDTDFTARVLDVYPNGTAINLGPEECGGAIRARFRQGFDKEVLLEPGKIEKYRIELFDIGHVFLAGHKIRIEISSSAYPMLHPNPNTGNPIATDTQSQIAHQTIFHDPEHPSTLFLPVIPANSTVYKKIFS